ncbi:MAG: hypothetical protein K6G80_05920 [Treponema sp.]|nr:hypothetical protein [Treponema sp.]
MKKRKLVLQVLAAVSSLVLASCASVPRFATVDMLDLLGSSASLYLYVPPQAFEDEACALLNGTVSGLAEKDARRIVKRTSAVYIAAGSREGLSLAASGSYPAGAVKSALSEKHGWKASPVSGTATTYTYYKQAGQKLELALPAPGLVCISKDVSQMVRSYDALVSGAAVSEGGWNPALYTYLTERPEDEIRFASPDPSAFIKTLFGSKQQIGLLSVYGSIKRSKSPEKCALTVMLEVADPRMIKATAALVKLAVFPVAAEIRITDSQHIQITEYTMSWKKLYGLMGI